MEIKFLTINIWFGGKVWDNLISFIHQEKPDILAIQEVYDSKEEDLEKRFRTIEEFQKEFGEVLPHSAFGATVIDTGNKSAPWGNAIFSKFPIKSTRTIFFDLPLTHYNFVTDTDARLAAEGMQEAEIEVNGKPVFVYSWHGVWNNHGGDTPQRKIMGDEIVKALEYKENIILAGDTNMNPDSNTILKLTKDLPIKSVFGQELTSTFNMSQKKNPGNYASSPVDMIFVSDNIEVISKKMHEVDVSDHFPLSALLKVA